MAYEYDFENLQYDTGYGAVDGTLIVEVEPVFTDETFDAHGPGELK